MSCKDSFFGNPTLASYFKFLMELFISVGTFPHSFGPIEDAVLVTHFPVHSMLRLHLDWFYRLKGISANSKTPFINSGAIPVLTLNISVINSSRFCWCNIVEVSLSSSSSNCELKSPYTTRRSLSWNLLIPFNWTIWKMTNYERISHKSLLLKLKINW